MDEDRRNTAHSVRARLNNIAKETGRRFDAVALINGFKYGLGCGLCTLKLWSNNC